MNERVKDLTPEEIRSAGQKFIEWTANYFEKLGSFPVVSPLNPGDIKKRLPENPPEEGEEFEQMIADLDSIITPGITHWAHPDFMAYFNSSGSAPGMFGDLVSSAYNINGMLWKTSPALTELEEVVISWFKKMMNIPDVFWGMVHDTASLSSMHAIAAARENVPGLDIRTKGMTGRSDLPKLKLYCSEQAHSSIDKGAITLGIGIDGIEHIPTDSEFRMIPEELRKRIQRDREKGELPFCAVTTIGTTATTSIDPLKEIAEICREENVWNHIDAAHAGVTAIVPEFKDLFAGADIADSIVINPHKWFFVPIDFSILFVKNPDVLKRAFSLVPEYLKTNEDDETTNLMDYGVALGRRFRALKLWFVIRYFGLNGLRSIIQNHLELGRSFGQKIESSESFELFAPVTFSTVCFRAVDKTMSSSDLNRFNSELLERINATGKLYLSGTKIDDIFFIRLSVSGIRTFEEHVENAWEILNTEYNKLKDSFE